MSNTVETPVEMSKVPAPEVIEELPKPAVQEPTTPMNTETNPAATPAIDLDAQMAALAVVPAEAPAPAKPAEVTSAPVAEKKRRGRPPGSKNKAPPAVKAARRGRPPGSKNKVKAVKAARRGRPPGSKNKVKAVKAPKAVKALKLVKAPKAVKASRSAGVKAQAQIDKGLNKRFIAEAKASGMALSHVIRDYIYRGAKFNPNA